jgi:hypothetical protein
MAVQKQDGLHTDVGESGSDLTGMEHRFCTRAADGTIALCGDNGQIAGVISEGRPVGAHTSFNTRGNPILKVIAGSAITRGQDVASDANGKAKNGSTKPFGTARNTVAAGEMVEIATYPTR